MCEAAGRALRALARFGDVAAAHGKVVEAALLQHGLAAPRPVRIEAELVRAAGVLREGRAGTHAELREVAPVLGALAAVGRILAAPRVPERLLLRRQVCRMLRACTERARTTERDGVVGRGLAGAASRGESAEGDRELRALRECGGAPGDTGAS